jgi:hypothetical protein
MELYIFTILLSLLSFIGLSIVYFLKKMWFKIEELTKELNELNKEIAIIKMSI